MSVNDTLPLITTIATALGFALVLGFIAIKLKLPTIVGYLLAGVIIGPFTPGLVAHAEIAAELAEIGVMLLMFGVGLHFSVEHLLEMRKIALPGALIQIFVATCMGAGVASLWGWEIGGALVFGLALSVASTVVLIRSLEQQGIINTINGQIAVSWLIVEDLAMVFILVFLPLFAELFQKNSLAASDQNLWIILGITILKITAFLAVMLFIGRWILPKLLWQIARTGSQELFTLCVIATAVSIAFSVAKLFDMSFALGAFFSGVIMRESKFSRRAAEETLPFRDAFAVLFFVSIGMLLNPYIFLEKPVHVFTVVGIIVVGKSIAAALLVLAFRYPLNTALIVSVSLAQIGEFSFILASLGEHLGLLPQEGQDLILAGALVSISINSLIFKIIKPLQSWLRARFFSTSFFERAYDPLIELPVLRKKLTHHVIVVGYGRVGRRIGRILKKRAIPFVVMEQNHELVEHLRRLKWNAIVGDAGEEYSLNRAHIADAKMLVLTIPDSFNAQKIIQMGQSMNPDIEVITRVPHEEEALVLRQEKVGRFFFQERELAKSMGRYIIKSFYKK